MSKIYSIIDTIAALAIIIIGFNFVIDVYNESKHIASHNTQAIILDVWQKFGVTKQPNLYRQFVSKTANFVNELNS